jgi:hypothetical protein
VTQEKLDTRPSHHTVSPPVYVQHVTMPIVVPAQTRAGEPNYSLISVVVAGWVLASRLSGGTTERSAVVLALGAHLALSLCAMCECLKSLRIARLRPILKMLGLLGLRAGVFALWALGVTRYAHQLSGSMPA